MKTLTSAIILLVLRELCYLSVCINAELAELVQNGNYVSEQKQDVETTDSSNAPLFPVSI